MAVRAYFVDGPMNGQWKAMQDLLPEIAIARINPIDWTKPNEDITAQVYRTQGRYRRGTYYTLGNGEVIKAWYIWQGWDDELQEVQESEGR